MHLFYTGDRILQGLLRILRFVGRYVRVKGASSNQDTINLLMSVYDHLEAVMVTEGMTEAGKRIFLMESIKQYQSWVENADIDGAVETKAPEAPVEELKPLEMERSEEIIHEEQDRPAPAQPAPVDEILLPARSEDEERIITAMKDLPPDEAFAYARDELKKTFQKEIDALKEEIRLLKSGG